VISINKHYKPMRLAIL